MLSTYNPVTSNKSFAKLTGLTTCVTKDFSSPISCSIGPNPCVDASKHVVAAKPSMADRPRFLSVFANPLSSSSLVASSFVDDDVDDVIFVVWFCLLLLREPQKSFVVVVVVKVVVVKVVALIIGNRKNAIFLSPRRVDKKQKTKMRRG
jgi:hypothetical protein